METNRETWGSRIGFIASLTGMAVGLGNVWRFPYLCAMYGGGAFLVPYLICLFVLGFGALMMEITLGKIGKSGLITALEAVGMPNGRKIGFIIIGLYFIILGYFIVKNVTN